MMHNFEQHCPDSELLSAYCDSQVSVQELDQELAAVGRHVSGCQSCQRTLAVYRQLDSLVESACRPPQGLVDRVMSAVRAAAPAPVKSPAHRRVALWLQAAAVVLVLAVVAVTVARQARAVDGRDGVTVAQYGPSVGESGAAEAVAASEAAAEALAASPAPAAEPHPARSRASGTVTGKDVQAVGIDRNAGRSSAPAQQFYLPPEVRHVWTTADLQQSRSLLNQLAKTSQSGITWVENDGEKSSLTGKVQLDDGQLQAFVDGAHGQGLQLMSPALPQPGNGARVKFTGQKVTYSLVLVRADAND